MHCVYLYTFYFVKYIQTAQELTMDDKILNVHLLKGLKKLTIHKNCGKKMIKRINKLKMVNKEVQEQMMLCGSIY